MLLLFTSLIGCTPEKVAKLEEEKKTEVMEGADEAFMSTNRAENDPTSLILDNDAPGGENFSLELPKSMVFLKNTQDYDFETPTDKSIHLELKKAEPLLFVQISYEPEIFASSPQKKILEEGCVEVAPGKIECKLKKLNKLEGATNCKEIAPGKMVCEIQELNELVSEEDCVEVAPGKVQCKLKKLEEINHQQDCVEIAPGKMMCKVKTAKVAVAGEDCVEVAPGQMECKIQELDELVAEEECEEVSPGLIRCQTVTSNLTTTQINPITGEWI